MASNEPRWGSKHGSLSRPGFSPYRPPSLSSEFGAVVSQGADMPLIDANGFIYVLHGRARIVKMDDDAAVLWRVDMNENRGAVAGAPVLHDGTIMFYTESGWAVCLDTATGTEKWSRKFAAGGSVIDMSAAVVHNGILLVSGKEGADEVALGFNRDIFGLDAKTGAQKWAVKMKLGLANVTPVAVDNVAVFQTINGEVACHNIADGASRWTTKQAGSASSGSAVICKETGMVYSTANLRAKKEWNKPRGGKGALRAFDLKTGELKWQKDQEFECNNSPIVAPVGPSGQLLVIFGLGANPGTWKDPLGDYWEAMVVAADAKTGDRVWQTDVFNWNRIGPGGTNEEARFRNVQTVCWSTATACGNGHVFIGWHGCTFFEFDGATGRMIDSIGDALFFPNNAVVGPGLLVVSGSNCYIYRNRAIKGDVVRELDMPLSESGCDHFWPSKMYNLKHTEYCEHPAVSDISVKPTFVAANIHKHFARIPGNDFYHKTPVVDSQGNIYIATNSSRTIILKRDGTVRGTINTGVMASNHCLHDRYFYICNKAGFVLKVDIETLEVKFNKKYCCYTNSDSWNPVVCDKQGILLVVGGARLLIPGQVGGNPLVYGLHIETGEQAWCKYLAPVVPVITYNFLPSVYEDKGYFIFSDNYGGLYCTMISDGTPVWEDLTIPDNVGAFTTGHCCTGPNGIIYNAYNRRPPPEYPMGAWNKGALAGGTIRAVAVETGEKKWMREFACECHVAPVVVPKGSGSEGYLVVAAQGSQGGYAPDLEDDLADDENTWPSGDAWESWIAAFDAENGDEIWRFTLPVWHHYEARGSFVRDIFLPDCFGSPTAADGKVYVMHWSGVAYCLEADTGKVLSSSDIGGSSQAAPVVVPGTLLLLNCDNIVGYRDEKLELDWLEKARAEGDPRADPRLWVHREFEMTKVDQEAIDLALHVHPTVKEYSKTTYKDIPRPFKRYSEETFNARLQRLMNKALEKSGQSPVPEAPTAKETKAEDPIWEVVGGGKAGGITVRKDQGLKSAELGRLSTGSRLRQIELKGERLHYEKVSGDGPSVGWVSLSFKGSDLVKRV